MTESLDLKLDDLLSHMGKAGKRLVELGACEGAAGNISMCVRWDLEISSRFPLKEQVELPQPVPELAGMIFIVSGSGCRLRDMLDEPTANIGCLVVDRDGKTGQLFSARERQFTRLTSEFNSHLAVHYDRVLSDDVSFNAVVHAQPPYITYLSHIEAYQDEAYLNQHLLRWEPETIIQFPQGIGILKYQTPSSSDLAEATTRSLHTHTLVIWARHGVICRSDASVLQACDFVEYAEAAARFEYLNLTVGEKSSGLSADEIRELCKSLNVHQEIY
jgi:rhamnulose-1-phosphate aldolase